MFCNVCDKNHLRGFCSCPEKVIEQRAEIATLTARNAVLTKALDECIKAAEQAIAIDVDPFYRAAALLPKSLPPSSEKEGGS